METDKKCVRGGNRAKGMEGIRIEEEERGNANEGIKSKGEGGLRC